MREYQQMQQLLIHLINCVWYPLHVSALHSDIQGAFLVPSERCSIEEQSILYISCSSIEHLSEGTRNAPEDGNVMLKHLGAAIHN
jgi:hypothetical protein